MFCSISVFFNTNSNKDSIWDQLLFLHVLPEFILQDTAETEQPVPFVAEDEQKDLIEEKVLFAAYHKRLFHYYS